MLWKMWQSGSKTSKSESTYPTLLAGKADVCPEGSSVLVCELCWVEATGPPLSCCTTFIYMKIGGLCNQAHPQILSVYLLWPVLYVYMQ